MRIRLYVGLVAVAMTAMLWPVGVAEAAPRWTLQSVASPGTNLQDVVCTTATDCVAVGADATGNVAVQRWDGSVWSTESAPSPRSGAILYGVSCASATTCVAVGDQFGSNATPLAQHWDGTGWQIVATPKPKVGGLRGVSCASPKYCIAVGGTGQGKPLALRWNGELWRTTAVAAPAGMLNGGLVDISCIGNNACVAVGEWTDTEGRTRILVQRWNGSGWSLQTTPALPSDATYRLQDISCVRRTGFCVAAGVSFLHGTNESDALVARFDGATWTVDALADTSDPSSSLFGVDCTSTASCQAVGYTGEAQSSSTAFAPLAFRWDGATWIREPTPTPPGINDSRPYAIDCSRRNECTMVGLSFDPSNNLHPLALRYA